MKIQLITNNKHIQNSLFKNNTDSNNRIAQNARNLNDTFEKSSTKNKQVSNFISFTSVRSNTSAQIIDSLRRLPKKILGKTKALAVSYKNSDTSDLNRKWEITNSLLASLDNIPNNEAEKHDFILNILTTDFSTGKVLDESELYSKTYQNALKKTKELAQYSKYDLKTILGYIINITGISKSNTVSNRILERRNWDIEVYERLEQRGLYELLKDRRRAFPHEEFSVYSIEYLGMIPDDAYKNTIYMYEKMGKQKLGSDITLIARLCAAADKETIDYILDNDLLNPRNVDIRNNTPDLLQDYCDIDLKTLKLIHNRGLLKTIPGIKRCLSIKDSEYLAENAATDDEWQVIKDRELLGLKLKGGSYLDAQTICELMNLDDEIFKKITERKILDIVSEEQWKIIKLATLNNDQWQILLDWGEDIDKIFNIDRFLKLSQEERELAKKRRICFSTYGDYELIRLNNDEWNNLTKRKLDETDENNHPIYSADTKARLAKLTYRQYQNAQERGLIKENYYSSQKTFTDFDEMLAKFDDEEYERFKQRNINSIWTYPEVKEKLTRMSDKQFKRITDDIIPFCEKCKKEDEYANYSANKTVAEYYTLVYLDDEKYELAKQLLETEYFDVKNKLTAREIKEIVDLDKEATERIKKIINPDNKIKRLTGKCFTKEEVLGFCKCCIDELDKIAELSNYLTPSQILEAKNSDLLDKIYNSKEFLENKELTQKINCSNEFENLQKDLLTKYLLNLANTNYPEMPLKNKVYVLDILNSANLSNELTQEEKDILRLDEHMNALQESLNHIIKPIEVSQQAVIKFMRAFFDINNQRIDKTLSQANFRQYSKNGLPLKYSRKKFLSDLSNLLKDYPKETRQKIYKKLNITAKEGSDKNIKGYDGIIDLTQLNKEGLEGEAYKIAHRFIMENQVVTQNKELNEILNSLIKAIPEYINVIGKQQDLKHHYSLDIHMFATLEEVLNNPKYQSLSNKDKFILKFATVLHDIAKPEGITDSGHPPVCALYVRDILNKESFKLPKEYKDRIIEMVKNHHWLADYNLKRKSAKQIAARFRRQGDLKIAQIMTEADIKAIDSNDGYYNMFKNALEDSMQIPVEEALDEINSSGQIILTSKIVDISKVPQVEYKGKKYRIINFRQIDGKQNLAEYGFEPGTTVDNLRLIVHMVRKDKLHNIVSAYYLSDPNTQGFLSGSYISANSHRTYNGNVFGVSIEAENVNIANASAKNQISGRSKDFSKFVEILSRENPQKSHRELISNYIKEHLDLNSKEYAQLYKKIQDLKYKSQLYTPKHIDLSSKKISTTELKKVIAEANDLLLATKGGNNEVLLYCPKINAIVAQVPSLDEVPQKILDFAQQYDFPIFLM